MNRRIKRRFDELGIEIPFPQRTLHFGETAPFAVQTRPAPAEAKPRTNGAPAGASGA